LECEVFQPLELTIENGKPIIQNRAYSKVSFKLTYKSDNDGDTDLAIDAKSRNEWM